MKLKALAFVVCLTAFACTQKQGIKKPVDIPKEAIGIINKDSTASPVITFIGKTNAPKIVAAVKPVVISNPNSDGLGTPNFTNYNTEQGLALASIACGYRDKSGNLWFGSQGAGVSRYDGKSFTNFDMSHGLAGTSVWSILQDNKGNFWFGTDGGGVSRYDGKSFTNFTEAHGLANNFVKTIIQDIAGNLWFGTTYGGVSRYDGKSFTNFTTAQGLANNNVWDIKEDKAGNLWFGTSGGGVSRYDGKSFINFTTKQGLASNLVTSIIEDKTGNLWFATNGGGVSRYDGKSFTNFTTMQGLTNNNIWISTEDKKGNLWFGTVGGGVSRYDGKSFANFTTTQGLPMNIVQSITEDKTGYLWFGTGGGGVCRYDGKSFTNFNMSHGLAGTNVWNIMQDKTGNLWFATTGGGVIRFDGKSFANYTTTKGLVNNNVWNITEDKTGNLWFATNGGGASRYDGKSFSNYTTAQGLANNNVWDIMEDKTGNLWFATKDGGVSRYDGKSFTNFSTAQGLANNTVHNIHEDKTGNFWFATYGGGVSRYDGKSFTNFTTVQGLANNFVFSITEDRTGNLWFATSGGGVSRFDGKSFINFSTANGLADNVAYDLVIDSLNNIFIGTNLGFSVLKGFNTVSNSEIIPAVNSLTSEELKKYRPVFEYYNNKTGYPVKDLMINAMFIDNKGILWGGCGDNKLVRFDYNALLRNTEPPAVLIQSVKIREENISWNNLVQNNKKQKTISSFDSLALLSEEVLTFGRTLSVAERDSMRYKFSGIKFDGISRFYPLPENLVLPYINNSISFDFVAIEPARHFLVRYQYILEGYEKEWSPVTDKTSATFGNMNDGVYTFKLKARSPDGVWSEPVIFTFKVLPPWYRTWWAYLLYAILFIGSIWRFVKYRSRSLMKEKRLLEEKVDQRTNELRHSLQELNETQTQLVQREKLASLGELTAGIAHVIQNPLNFVNNFSEVNKELLVEMKDEMSRGNYADAESIANDVIDNENKINHHGKRADAIVKGMLQHSKNSSGIKEPTNINTLADEYLRLVYHGLKAKDKSFNDIMKTDFEPHVGAISIIPQDIGRVLLNLINNAFYAVNEKKKDAPPGYEPTVWLQTKKVGEKVEISVRDNGNGIPDKIKEKIFQPFFTTKPTGQGTGLGLSLSYDIVKAHGGEIKVETWTNLPSGQADRKAGLEKEGLPGEQSGTEFIIQLPVT